MTKKIDIQAIEITEKEVLCPNCEEPLYSNIKTKWYCYHCDYTRNLTVQEKREIRKHKVNNPERCHLNRKKAFGENMTDQEKQRLEELQSYTETLMNKFSPLNEREMAALDRFLESLKENNYEIKT